MRIARAVPGYLATNISTTFYRNDSGRVVSFRGSLRPVCFLTDEASDPQPTKVRRITTTSSGWHLGKSLQNDCLHVKVDGMIIRRPEDAIWQFNPTDHRIAYKGGQVALTIQPKGSTSSWSEESVPDFMKIMNLDPDQIVPPSLYVAESIEYEGYYTSPRGRRISDYFACHQYSSGGWYGNFYFSNVWDCDNNRFLGDNTGATTSCRIYHVSSLKMSGDTITVHLDAYQDLTVRSLSVTGDRYEIASSKQSVSFSRNDFFYAYPTSVDVLPPTTVNGSYDIRSLFEFSYPWEEGMASNLDQVNFTSSNFDAYLHDLSGLKSQISGDLKALESLAKGAPGKLKIAAGLFLSIHYGYKLTAMDTAEFAKAIKATMEDHTNCVSYSVNASMRHNQTGGITVRRASGHCSVYYDAYKKIYSLAMKLAEGLDAVPDISNVWDMIPFSFVVDWFVNIGDLAQGIDDFYTLTQEHTVLGTIQSTTTELLQTAPANVTAAGKYEYRIYNRTCMPGYYPWPRFSFQTKNPTTNLYHWMEASALVVSTRP